MRPRILGHRHRVTLLVRVLIPGVQCMCPVYVVAIVATCKMFLGTYSTEI
jgi:hypothetical protein